MIARIGLPLVLLTATIAGTSTAALSTGEPATEDRASDRSVDRALAERPGSHCVPADTTDYYSFPLRTPSSDLGGSREAGRVRVSYPPSPFGLPVDPEGRLVHRLEIAVGDDFRSRHDRLVVWVAPPELDPVRRLGSLDADGTVTGEVALNKYLVFVTEEPADADEAGSWRGPVVLKGKSRSGRMQSAASHGALEPEPC